MLMTIHRILFKVLVAFAVMGLAMIPIRGAEPDPRVLSYVLPDDIQWRRSENADTAVLQGDSSKPEIYIQLVRWHAGHNSHPHSHPNDRYITVLDGTWWLGWGSEYDFDSTFPVTKGSYVVHHANEIHYDGAKDEDALILIVGMGPAAVNLVEQE